MPLIGKPVVVDPVWRAESESVVSAANEHYVSCASARRHHAGQHVNIVVSRTARVINRQEQHPIQTRRIYPASSQIAAHIDVLGYLVKGRRLCSDLRIARSNT